MDLYQIKIKPLTDVIYVKKQKLLSNIRKKIQELTHLHQSVSYYFVHHQQRISSDTGHVQFWMDHVLEVEISEQAAQPSDQA